MASALLAATPAATSSPSPSPFVAVGLLSTARGNTKAKNATVSLGRRTILRQIFGSFRHDLVDRVALRFLVARNGNHALNASSPIVMEAERERDILFLNMTEAKHRCSLKYYLWFKLASQAFPSAGFFMLGDDDVYIQFAHLEADLRLVASQTSDQHVLYGLIMWKALITTRWRRARASRVGTISIGPPWRNAEQCPCAGGGPQRYFLKTRTRTRPAHLRATSFGRTTGAPCSPGI